MSGQVRASTPWMRDAIRLAEPESLARVQEAIPDGTFVSLFCGGKPRPLGASLFRGHDQLVRVEPAYYSVAAAVDAVLARYAAEVAA